MRRALACALAVVLVSAGAACRRSGGDAVADAGTVVEAAPTGSAPSSPSAVAEVVPRCRADGAALPLPGEDVVVGDAALGTDAVFVGLTRRDGGKRVASVARVPFDLGKVEVIDVGPAHGDDPPPSPRTRGGATYVAHWARGASATARELRLGKLDARAVSALGAVAQQADESFAFDVAFPADGKPVVVWDEDAPRRPGALLADHGVVKVQVLGAPAASIKIASPETSDAEEPRIVPRTSGGHWVAWLARRTEPTPDGGGDLAEGPGERRAFRWVELVALDAKGEVEGTPRRLTSERGRASSFTLVSGDLFGKRVDAAVVVVDETAPSEGAGARILAVTLEGDHLETTELVASGVAHAAADLLPAPEGKPGRWLAWTDLQERVTLAMGAIGKLQPSTEPAFQGARPLAAVPRGVVAAGARPSGAAAPAGAEPVELRAYVCP